MAGLARSSGVYHRIVLLPDRCSFGNHRRVKGVADYFVPVFFAVMGMMWISGNRPVLGFGIVLPRLPL